MDESTGRLLRRIATACRRIGAANDLEDRGDPSGSRDLREQARREIAEALGSATSDDRGRIECLFGPDLPARCDEQTWHSVEGYALFLLELNPELAVAPLRGRHAAFVASIEELRHAADVLEARLTLRYTMGVPWMPNTFRSLLQRRGERLGTYGTPPVSFELDLAGNGIRCELRRSGPEPCDLLIDGVLVHVELDRATASSGTTLVLRSRDRDALARVTADLGVALAADGWLEVGCGRG
ncbi:MAG: hypothetical protein NDJ94_14785 [Vicinamibacteria bacterium]|nr:hypothetical protein [Vicinamibacteria bacterium]